MGWRLLLIYSAMILSIVPVLMGLYKRNSLDRANNLIWITTICILIADWTAYFIALYLKSNWFFLPFGTALYAVPIFLYFSTIFPKTWRKSIYFALAIFVLLQISESTLLRTVNDYNGLTNTYLGFVLGFLAVRGMIFLKRDGVGFQLKKGQPYINVFSHSSMWFMFGIAIFYGANIVNNAFSNYIIKLDIDTFFQNWGIFIIISVFYRVVFIVGFSKISTVKSV